jgi:hypothetical protein
MKFDLSEEQITKLEEWKRAIKVVYGEYGLFTYSFTPNGIGVEVEVYSDLAKTSLDITEIENW